MDCIVTIGGNLRPQCPRPSGNPLSLRSCLPISENCLDDLESTIITKRRKYVGGITSCMSVVVFQVGFEWPQNRSVMELYKFFGDLKLLKKNLTGLEPFNQLYSRPSLLASCNARDGQKNEN